MGTPTGPRAKPPQSVLDKLAENVSNAIKERYPAGKPSNKDLAEKFKLSDATLSQVLRGSKKDWTLTSLLALREFTQLSLDEMLGLPQTQSMVERALRRVLHERPSTVPPASTDRPSKRPSGGPK